MKPWVISHEPTYSKNHTWPTLKKDEPNIMMYTNSRYETEKHEIVHE